MDRHPETALLSEEEHLSCRWENTGEGWVILPEVASDE